MGCNDGSKRPDLMGDHPAAKGLAALRTGDAKAALAFFDELIRLEPNGLPGHFLRVEALDRGGDREGARSALRDLIARFPFAEGACRERLALIALRESDPDAAVVELQKAIAAGWTNADAILRDPAAAPYSAHAGLAAVLHLAREKSSPPT